MMIDKGLAIITGASSGIGACVAKGLSQDGYQAVLIARSKQNLENVADEIQNTEGFNIDREPVIFPVDITNHKEIDEIFEKIRGMNKQVSVVVNSAAVWLDGPLDSEVEKFREIIDLNLVSQYVIIKHVVEIMKKQGNGYIFNVASRAGKYGFAGDGLYSASKFALVGLGESMYRELNPLGIKVTTLCPGWVNTQMAQLAGTPLKDEEMIQPEDLLNTIRYLLTLSKSACVKEIFMESPKSIL